MRWNNDNSSADTADIVRFLNICAVYSAKRYPEQSRVRVLYHYIFNAVDLRMQGGGIMLVISIDGACRRNGQPSCVSAGGVYVQHLDETDNVLCSEAIAVHEKHSTNQRGEMLALLVALDYICTADQEAYVITDSEYLFNAMTKGWINSWQNKGWITASGDPVKNTDIWREIYRVFSRCQHDIHFYHIKGHCIPFGKVTADNLLSRDQTGLALFKQVTAKYDIVLPTKVKNIEAAQVLSEKNNGFRLADDILKRFIVMNTVADAVATKRVDTADREK